MKVYIAGPMCGYPEYNYPAFHQAEQCLEVAGAEPLNPARNAVPPEDAPRHFFLGEAISTMLEANCIVVLPGWQKSRGACLEMLIASELEMPVYDYAIFEQSGALNESSQIQPREARRSIIDALTPLLPANIAPDRTTVDQSSEPAGEAESAKAPKKTILQRATEIVDGDRQHDYGHPYVNHTRTADYFSTYLGKIVTAEDVCILNILQKVSRNQNRPSHDSILDIAGYARNVEMVREKQEEYNARTDQSG